MELESTGLKSRLKNKWTLDFGAVIRHSVSKMCMHPKYVGKIWLDLGSIFHCY